MGKLYKALEKVEKDRVPGNEPEQQPQECREPPAEEAKPEPDRRPYMEMPREVKLPSMDEMLVAYREPGSIAAEQFRKLRTQLLGMRLPSPPKTIMVTSATDSEGKTLVSTNLATVLAHDLRSYALLVDADLRNPALSRWFGLQSGRGLADYLAAGASIPELLTKTNVDKLTPILSSGSFQANPVELIGSKKMETLVREMRERYSDRYIIFDSSPLLATHRAQRAHAPRRRDHTRRPRGRHASRDGTAGACHRGKRESPGHRPQRPRVRVGGPHLALLRIVRVLLPAQGQGKETEKPPAAGDASSRSSEGGLIQMIETPGAPVELRVTGTSSRPRRRRNSKRNRISP